MLLLVDVGNTQTVIGIYEDVNGIGEYRCMWRIRTEKDDTADDLQSRLEPLFSLSNMDMMDIDRACIASVVPRLRISWEHLVAKTWGIVAIVCNAASAAGTGLFSADYPHPGEIGSDRVADAIAARALFGSPVVVVDFGTATNIEVIDARGCFIGGVIAPGISTGASALFSNATLIADTDLVVPDSPIGRSTDEAVCSGLIYGEVGRVDGLLARIFEELGQRCCVVATGGLVHTISNLSEHISDICPELTLEGLRLLANARRDGPQPK